MDPHYYEALQSSEVRTKINGTIHPPELYFTCSELETLNKHMALLSVEGIILLNKGKTNSIPKHGSMQTMCAVYSGLHSECYARI